MRTMYDSVDPFAIPTSARMVAGYVDGHYAWSAPGWARFPAAVKVRIAVYPWTNDGHVLDCESGDATPVQCPGWVEMRRAAGWEPSIYCNTATWSAVRSAFAQAGVKEPPYWVAAYPGGGAVIPPGAVAHQYADPPGSGGNYDLSVVADYWPGVDQGGSAMTTPTPDQYQEIGRMDAFYNWLDKVNYGNAPINGEINAFKAWLVGQFQGVLAAIATADTDVKTADADVKAGVTRLAAAIAAQPTGGQVDVPTLVTALAGPLASALSPLLPPGTTPAQLLSALATQLQK